MSAVYVLVGVPVLLAAFAFLWLLLAVLLVEMGPEPVAMTGAV